jgi:hypothetical protein
MAVRRGTPGNTLAFMPTRELNLLIDPAGVPSLRDSIYSPTIRLINDLRNLEVPVTVHLLLPTHLTDPTTITWQRKLPLL